MKKRYIAIILIIVVIALSLLLLVKSCNAKKDTIGTNNSSNESTLAVVNSDETTTTLSETETTKQVETKKVDDVITTATFVSLTGPKSGLTDKGDYYELSVSVNEKDSNGDVYTSGTDTIKISKDAVVTWYKDASFTDKLSINEYLSMTDFIRIYYSDFNGSVIYAKDSNGCIIAFFDGQFS